MNKKIRDVEVVSESKETTTNESKTNTFAIVAVVLMVINVLLLFFPNYENLNLLYIVSAMVIIAIAQIIFGSIAKKQIIKNPSEKGKVMAKVSVIFGILGAVYFSFSLLGLYMLYDDDMRNTYICPQVTECEDNNDGTKKCMFAGEEIICRITEEENKEEVSE